MSLIAAVRSVARSALTGPVATAVASKGETAEGRACAAGVVCVYYEYAM